jgi:hypothetical protein
LTGKATRIKERTNKDYRAKVKAKAKA